MRKRDFDSSAYLFAKSIFSLSLFVSVAFFPLERSQAQEDPGEIPGLPVARLSFSPISSSIGKLTSTGTEVGGRVAEVKKSLQAAEKNTSSILCATRDLYEKVINEVNIYYSLVSKIEAKLQLGTTPLNPQIVALQNKALQELEAITGKIVYMSELSTELSQISHAIKELSSEIRFSFQLPGALDEDHANLILLSEEATKMKGSLARVISTITTNTQRQKEWLNRERQYFASLSLAVEKGNAHPLNNGARAPQYPMPVSFHEHELRSNEGTPPHQAKGIAQEISVRPPQPAVLQPPLALIPASPPLEQKPSEGVEQQPIKILTKPLSKVQIPSRPEIKAIDEPLFIAPAPQTREPPLSYAMVSKGRSPLAIVEPNYDVWSYRWYLFSSAKRGLKRPSGTIEIVNTMGTEESFRRAEEIKSLLVEMGLNPEQVCIINAKVEGGGKGQISIFGEN